MDYAISNLLVNNRKVYKYYLILININTKFLFAAPIQNNTTPNIKITQIIIKSINDHLATLGPNLKINNIRADGDRKFGKMIEDNDRPETIEFGKMIYKRNSFLEYLESENITLYLNSSPFLNKNRVIDLVIRTIRDKIGVRSILWLDINYMAQIVDEYNHTPHSSFYHMFTPFQVQFTRDLERYFMKKNEYKLEEINQKQKEIVLKEYEPKNILLIHLDFSKTSNRFNKKRRNFNKLAKFIAYEFGNVKCNIYNIEKHIKNPITIPIY
jgi:hypothetical protein